MKSYEFKYTWWLSIRELHDEERLHVINAINCLAFEDDVPELTASERAVFAPIRYEIQKNAEDAERKRLILTENGRKGGRPKKTKINQMVLDETKENQMVLKEQENNEKEKNQKKEDNKEIENSSSSIACAKKEFLSWICSDGERAKLLLSKNGLISEDKTPDEVQEVIRPLVNEYTEGEYLKGSDLYTKTPKDVISHFAAWLPTYLKKNKNYDNSGNQSTPNDPGSALQERVYDFS